MLFKSNELAWWSCYYKPRIVFQLIVVSVCEPDIQAVPKAWILRHCTKGGIHLCMQYQFWYIKKCTNIWNSTYAYVSRKSEATNLSICNLNLYLNKWSPMDEDFWDTLYNCVVCYIRVIHINFYLISWSWRNNVHTGCAKKCFKGSIGHS